MLEIYVLKGDANVDWKENKMNVMVTADRWHYATGRDIEFIAVGLPEQFAFIVQEPEVKTGDGLIRNGDCRKGSWAGMASKIGVNKFQGIQSTGMANPVSGLITLGTTWSISYNEIIAPEERGTGRTMLGERNDFALGSSYAKGVDTPSGKKVQIRRPYYSDEVYDYVPSRVYRTQFGDTVESDTRTIRTLPSGIRREFYKRTGAIATTCFESYGGNLIGGITHLANSNRYWKNPTPSYEISKQYLPQTEGGVGETVVGNRGQGAWRRWLIAGAEKTSPYKGFCLLLNVNADGTFSYSNNQNLAPGTHGRDHYPEAFTFFSDTKSDTDNNSDNRKILLEAYLAARTRTTAYKVKYPIMVPVKFQKARYIKGTSAEMPITSLWTTEADFINHEYTIGGE
ncbi:hypothetical protein ACFSZP_22060 [Paraglaciecola agarilytica]